MSQFPDTPPDFRFVPPPPSETPSLLEKKSDKISHCKSGKITVRAVREWLATLPEEFQDAEFTGSIRSGPFSLKRIVALKSNDGTHTSVCCNPMGTHLPFDDSYNWHHVLS